MQGLCGKNLGEGHMFRKRRGSALTVLLYTALGVCFCLLLWRVHLYRAGAGWYAELREQIGQSVSGDPAEDPGENGQSERRGISSLSWERPPVSAEALARSGAAAWLRIGDIRYPVMQAGDNDWYLHRLPDGTVNPAGSLFLQAENSPAFTDRNSIIYGHNMADGSMFGKLKQFRQEPAGAVPFDLYLPDGTLHRYRLFSVVSTEGGSEAFTIRFPDDAAFIRYQEEMLESSLWQSGMVPEAGNRLVTLVTCDGPAGTHRRLLVQGAETEILGPECFLPPRQDKEAQTQKESAAETGEQAERKKQDRRE